MKQMKHIVSTMPRIAEYASVIALGSLVSTTGFAQEANQGQQQGSQSKETQSQREQSARQSSKTASNRPAKEKASQGPNPYARANNAWISLSGTIGMVEPHAFVLDYGDGTIQVEMDDGDRDADAYALRMGDNVTVTGMIDDDFFETRKIEAGSVYVEKVGRYFFASALDEEDFYSVTYVTPADGQAAAVHGLVTAVSGDEFTIDNGLRSVRVDVDEMSYDPLDDEGYQKVEVGDIVRATGTIDDDFFESRELKASAITTLVEELG